jgi:hypothetical protein
MKGILWNSNGFKDLKKHRFISELTKEQNLSFIGIIETGMRSFTSPFMKNLCAGRESYGMLWNLGGDKEVYS